MTQTLIFKILTRKHGIRLTAQASKYLANLFIEIEDEQTLMENLDFIANEFVHLESKPKILEIEHLDEIMQGINKKRSGENVNVQYSEQLSQASNYLTILNTFEIPMFEYNIDDKVFLLRKDEQSLFADQKFKTHRYRDRFDLLLQRVLRQPSFRQPVNEGMAQDYHQLTPISNLRGKPTGRYLIFGMLTQIEDGKLHIEDLNSNLELKFTENCLKSEGVFTQNTFVIVEGIYEQNGVL